MIPLLRSLEELDMITTSRVKYDKIHSGNDLNFYYKIKKRKNNPVNLNNKQTINLPDLPRTTKRKWIKSKEVVSRLLEEMNYNNQIQPSYDLTLQERQRSYDNHDVA